MSNGRWLIINGIPRDESHPCKLPTMSWREGHEDIWQCWTCRDVWIWSHDGPHGMYSNMPRWIKLTPAAAQAKIEAAGKEIARRASAIVVGEIWGNDEKPKGAGR